MGGYGTQGPGLDQMTDHALHRHLSLEDVGAQKNFIEKIKQALGLGLGEFCSVHHRFQAL